MVQVLASVIMPNSLLAAGVRGSSVRKNARASSQSGYMTANIIQARTLRKYTLGTVPLTVTQWQQLEGLFEVTEAGAFGFLLDDPKDQTATAAQGFLQPWSGSVALGTMGLGFGVPAYRLHKRYTSAGSALFKDRRITRPAAVTVRRNGTPVTVGAAAGNVAIDFAQGIVTFVPDASQAIASITPGATTVLNFANGTGMVAAMVPGERIYLSGITGTAAAALNGLSHVIASEGATSITINTATTGLAGAAGTAARYPQAADALSWGGSFRVPVQFETDEIDFDLVRSGPADTRLIAGPSVTLVEVMEP